MRYTYVCARCGPFDYSHADDWIHCSCGERAKRDWSFHADFSFQPYFAPSFGQVVRSRTHAKDLAKIASEEQTLRTGIETNLTVVDTHDDAAVGIDTEHKKAIQEQTRKFTVANAAEKAKLIRQNADRKAANTAKKQGKQVDP